MLVDVALLWQFILPSEVLVPVLEPPHDLVLEPRGSHGHQEEADPDHGHGVEGHVLKEDLKKKILKFGTPKHSVQTRTCSK